MINQHGVTSIVTQLQAGEQVPRSSIMLAIGYLQYTKAKHQGTGDVEKIQAVDKVIAYLREKTKR